MKKKTITHAAKTPKPAKTKTKTARRSRIHHYTDSHWGIFGLQGLFALLFGWFIIFTDFADTPALVFAVGLILLTLGAIELLNVITRHRRGRAWSFALTVAALEVAVGVALLATNGLSVAVHLTIIACYTIIRGLFDVIIAVRSLTDATDKFLWVVTGIFGMVLGFVIFNSGSTELSNTTFIKVFGTYLMVFGLANLVYAVHSKNTLPAKAK